MTKRRRTWGKPAEPPVPSPPAEAVPRLGRSLLTLLSLVFLGFLVVRDVLDLFPAIKAGGWLLLAAGFALALRGGLVLAAYLSRRLTLAEERAEWLAVLLGMGLMALTCFLLRDVVRPLVTPWFH